MKRNTLYSLFSVLAIAFALPASALPVRATFNGTVTDYAAFFGNVQSEYPIGTAASFDLTFDDGILVGSAPPPSYDLTGVSGTASIGSQSWQVDAGHISSYTYSLQPGNPILNYQLQMTGTGPTINNNGFFFGLFMHIAPDLSALATDPFLFGFGFPFDGGEYYGYASLTGNYSVTRGNVSVPEPGVLMLMLAGLAMLGAGYSMRKSRGMF
jgi:PEP-CTERM motif